MLEHNLDGTTTSTSRSTRAAAIVGALARRVRDALARGNFRPCIQGAVFEARFTAAPRLTLLDGYVTIAAGGDQPWHLHLCVGLHAGTAARPTPLGSRPGGVAAPLFRDRDRSGRQSVWGFRMWNGRDEQMLTVFFPNPWLDPTTMHPRRTPDWACLATWMELRERYAGTPKDAPPNDETPPILH
jgi:hypothetical protein